MTLRLITAPLKLPVTVEEVRDYLNRQDDDKDELIERLIRAATAYYDGFTDGILGHALITQTWEYVSNEFPSGDEIKLARPPIQSVTSVKYDGTSADDVTFSPGSYTVDLTRSWAYVVLNSSESWPSTKDAINAVRVRFVAGYGAEPENVPENIRTGILFRVEQLLGGLTPEEMTAFEKTETTLIAPSRRLSL